MIVRRLDPQRASVKEPLGDAFGRHPDAVRQHAGRPTGRLSDVGAGRDGKHHGPGDEARVVVVAAKAVSGHGRADLPVQEVVGVLPPPTEDVQDGARPVGTGRGVQVVPSPTHGGHHPYEHQGGNAQLRD